MYDVIHTTSHVYNHNKKHLSVLSERTGRIHRKMKCNPSSKLMLRLRKFCQYFNQKFEKILALKIASITNFATFFKIAVKIVIINLKIAKNENIGKHSRPYM